MQRQSTSISDELLMKFMERIEKSVSDIEHSVSNLSIKVNSVETVLEEREKNEVKRATLLTVIFFLASIIGGLLGYIWGLNA